MTDNAIDWKEWEGRIVPRQFTPGFVVLSYLVSFIGAWTTLELLHRRTAGKGLYNWLLLFSSSISMGGISIWCMHYIGNRAIVLGDGHLGIQIAYNQGFTALSFFVPIIVLLAAFMAVGSDDKISRVRLPVGGALAGLAICGMHYLGQAGISNYTCIYSVGYVVGSAVIAVFASITALSVFFALRAAWTDSWWKRAMCAVILGCAVFGMHWVASVGTNYRLKMANPGKSHDIPRNSTVIVIIVLSVAACVIILGLTIITQRRRTRSANRAQQVLLASAIFDPNGRLMVTPEGLLPNQKVTTSYVEWSFDEVFGTSHPVFQWIFRTTRNWSSISTLIPGMRTHIQQTRKYRPELKSETDPHDSEDVYAENYSVIFRELFCTAAADLAEQLNQPLENVGVLFDEILNTGEMHNTEPGARRKGTKSSADEETNVAAARVLSSKGQLLILVRSVDRPEADRLAASGYRFAEVKGVAPILSRSMQINCDDLPGQLTNMYEYSKDTPIMNPGVHLALFALRARVRGGFDILVPKNRRNQLPAMKLPIDSLRGWESEYLSQLDGMSVSACLKFLNAKSPNAVTVSKEQLFAIEFRDALVALKDEIDDPIFNDALLIAHPLTVPCRGPNPDAPPGRAAIITFRLIVPIQFRAHGQKLEFVPLSFFRTQQYVYRNSPDHQHFTRKVHREFAPILSKRRPSVDDGRKSIMSSGRRESSEGFKRLESVYGDNAMDMPMPALPPRAQRRFLGVRFGRRHEKREALTPPRLSLESGSEAMLVEDQFGGIMVSQEVSVIVGRDEEGGGGDDGQRGTELVKMMPQAKMGTRGGATKELDEPETYVDRLIAICVKARG
ncbi:hypothetical protein VE01_10030 [Pseudogymnoascus verrucosus]|uniref:MHYT domain-containing protein n=1 Tax=Pseudogymnoascus verrucosus TaxID=342668 RepID=A0A1B8G8K4_9PEZI|nr:uncharacterized protein VE01_10030 [Pseudogymnoascus verrucosus]OBT92158.1 hypothetical protein VE01_10030 [Pseudogymnoascus verrucosus]